MLLIYIPSYSSRCNYVFDFIFNHNFGIDFNVTTDITLFQSHPGESINYSDSKLEKEFFIKSFSFLFENKIKIQKIKVSEKQELPILFENEADDMGFDIFSSVFYMIARYEEYLPFESDEFGRFKAENSLAFKNNFLQIPIVDKWIQIFRELLQIKFPALQLKQSKPNAIVTYDIDVAYKFLGRNLFRTGGSILKDLVSFKLKNIQQRIKVLRGTKKDPWDVYVSLTETILRNNLNSIFFFLLGDKSKHDRNLNFQNPVMKNLINDIQKFSEIGIHPSYYSISSPEKIMIEKKRLENLTGKKITKSRQHYLKFKLPETYNSLLSAGITEDYSMGFASMPGFRAGTSKPFYFYDLKNEKATTLKIFPITFMESTLDIPGDSEKAYHKIISLLDEVKKVNGTFISLWHNHTISNKEEYKELGNIHEKMLHAIINI